MGQLRWGDRLIPRGMFWSRSIIEPHRCLERKLGYMRGLMSYELIVRLLVFYYLAVFGRSVWMGTMSNLLDIERSFEILAGK